MSADDRRLRALLSTERLLSTHELNALDNLAPASMETALRRLDLLPSAQLDVLRSQSSPFPWTSLENYVPPRAELSALSPTLMSELRVLPLEICCERRRLDIASASPGDIRLRDALSSRLPGWTVRWYRADRTELDTALSRYARCEKRLSALLDENCTDAIRLVDRLLRDAVIQGASDIHLQPEDGFARVRLRVDGVLELAALLPPAIFLAMVVRIKVLAELDVADSRAVQDGQFRHEVSGETHGFRVSIMPTDYGEAVVLRLLHARRRVLTLSELGVDPEMQSQLQAAMAVREGLVLLVGPTGSGKTTTLYALLETVRSGSCNIVTLEDPVEYVAPWLRQTSVKSSAGMDFVSGVRAALRQDPDVLLIGEIRDAESCRVALRAALTGHRVLSTLHANSALAALPRLRELGAAAGLLASNLVAVVGQRLMRRLCDHCRLPNGSYFDAVGCAHCGHRGYRGRFAVCECLQVDDAVAEYIAGDAAPRELAAVARQAQLRAVAERAWARVCRGDTSVDEYRRVIGPPPEAGRA